MKKIDRVKELLRLARALDYDKDPNPEHWKTINGAKVHLDKNGKYDGGAGGKFNGDYHFGGHDWKQKKADIENLANVFKQVTAQKQAQANAQGSSQGNGQGNASENATQNVAPKATQGAGSSDIIETQKEIKEWKDKKEKLQSLKDDMYKKYRECEKLRKLLEKLHKYGEEDTDLLDAFNEKLHEYQDAIDLYKGSKSLLESEITLHRIVLAAKGVPFTSKAWDNIENEISNSSVTVKELRPAKLKSPLSSDEICQKLAGGDMTPGSCASVALAYIANKHGLDVLDFRGGASWRVFSNLDTIKEIGRLPGVKTQEFSSADYMDVVDRIKSLPIGKEYYLTLAMHAAIVRWTGKRVEYLELQDKNNNNNGWKPFGDTLSEIAKTVDFRFGRANKKCTNNGMTLMDVDSFKNCAELEKLVGFINTRSNKQKKGVKGNVK